MHSAKIFTEEHYCWVIEDIPLLICCFQPDGEITYVNHAYCEYFAKTPEELVGSNFLSLIPREERQSVMADISALTKASPTLTHEHRVMTPIGNIRWQRWTNRALFDARGRAIGYQSIGEDTTEQKRAEKELTRPRSIKFWPTFASMRGMPSPGWAKSPSKPKTL